MSGGQNPVFFQNETRAGTTVSSVSTYGEEDEPRMFTKVRIATVKDSIAYAFVLAMPPTSVMVFPDAVGSKHIGKHN